MNLDFYFKMCTPFYCIVKIEILGKFFDSDSDQSYPNGKQIQWLLAARQSTPAGFLSQGQ